MAPSASGGEPGRRWLSISALKELLREYWADRPMELAAALSYYTLLSLAPLVLMTVAVAGLVFEHAAVEGKLVTEVRALVGDSGAEVVHTVLRNAHDSETGIFSVVVAMVVLLVGATTVFVQLQAALNRIWEVDVSAHGGAIRSFVKERLLSLAMVLGVGFLLLVSLLVNAGLSAVGDSARGAVGDAPAALHTVNATISLVVITLLFGLMFKVLPEARVSWREVWIGAIVTSVLFTLGKYLIGLYLGRASVGSAYGAAGSLVVLTVWVYYASMIVFLGAKLTYVRSRHSRGAVRHGNITTRPPRAELLQRLEKDRGEEAEQR
jgi:membrane protein